MLRSPPERDVEHHRIAALGRPDRGDSRRSIPGSMRRQKRAIAISAPVLPADTANIGLVFF